MIKVLFSPQRNDGDKLIYDFTGEVVMVGYGELTDTFDFTNLPDGKAEGIESALGINPILSAERKDGILHLELLNFIGAYATEEEKFPEWVEV